MNYDLCDLLNRKLENAFGYSPNDLPKNSILKNTNIIDDFFEKAMKCGAVGGKILGAGGGGFSLFWVDPDNRERFLRDFDIGVEVPFRIDFQGTTCVLNSDLTLRK